MQDLSLYRKTRWAMVLTRTNLFVLMGLLLVSTLLWVPEHKAPNMTIAILVLLPLVLILPWILKKNTRAHIWLCFMLLGYFLNVVPQLFIPQYGLMPYLELVVLITLFVSAMLFARWQHRLNR